MKICKKCGVPQKENCFFPHPRTKDGLQGHCKLCHAKRAREIYLIRREDPLWKAKKRETYRLWELANPDKVKAKRRRSYTKEKGRKYNRRTVYGIEPREYQEMLTRQHEKCAICERAVRLVIDHDHATGQVRGLLCYRCNCLVGMVERAETFKAKILQYLSDNRSENLVEEAPSAGDCPAGGTFRSKCIGAF